ncbi:MAG: SDR family NAD(P)-dependent oxidoreductase, partial [Myxococcaceae bacterium]
ASGIGFETARALAGRGAEVLVVDRNEEAGRAAVQRIGELRPGAKVRFLPLELGSQRALRDFAAPLLAEGRPLDLLVNNAGIQPLSERRTTADGFELTFGIGHLGHFALTGLLLRLLIAAPRARVVTVSSMVHGQGRSVAPADGGSVVTCTNGTSVFVAHGSNGTNGNNGTNGAASFSLLAEMPAVLTATVTQVTVASPPVVSFSVKDGAGRGAAGLKGGSSGQVRFDLAKLVVGTNGDPDSWQNYVNRRAALSDGGNPVTQGTTERGTLVDNGDGTYVYTFQNDSHRRQGPGDRRRHRLGADPHPPPRRPEQWHHQRPGNAGDERRL